MERIEGIFEEIMNEALVDITVSGARSGARYQKIRIRPVRVGGQLMYQSASYTGTQVFHRNMSASEAAEKLRSCMAGEYKQAQIRTLGEEITLLSGKKGRMTLRSRKIQQEAAPDQTHNRTKHYILEEGQPVPFLIDLGVMTGEGRIVRARYDKFRQINRFLEFIEDILTELPSDRPVRIIDFGCGKSYLTFAMYYYLKVLKGYDLQITGLDLKKSVIEHCNALAEKYGYEGLSFLCGDIADYECAGADMVVTLHACDTATDYALYKAIRWQAGVILSVPCCQHELNRTMDCEPLAGAFRYGIIRERTAALMTDAMRAQLLEQQGYKTQLLEFIDMEHTPKNILIRAIRQQKLLPAAQKRQKLEEYERCRTFLGAAPVLEKLLYSPEGSDTE